MNEACRTIEPVAHRARMRPLRSMRARRVSVLAIVAGLALLHPPRAAANPFVEVEFLLYSGGHGVGFEMAEGVAIDRRNGEIAVANSGRGRIEFFRADGRPTGAFEHPVRRADGTRMPGQPRRQRRPASRISRIPAAMSHGDRPYSQKPSKRPAATQARSSAAAPNRRTPATSGTTAASVSM